MQIICICIVAFWYRTSTVNMWLLEWDDRYFLRILNSYGFSILYFLSTTVGPVRFYVKINRKKV